MIFMSLCSQDNHAQHIFDCIEHVCVGRNPDPPQRCLHQGVTKTTTARAASGILWHQRPTQWPLFTLERNLKKNPAILFQYKLMNCFFTKLLFIMIWVETFLSISWSETYCAQSKTSVWGFSVWQLCFLHLESHEIVCKKICHRIVCLTCSPLGSSEHVPSCCLFDVRRVTSI